RVDLRRRLLFLLRCGAWAGSCTWNWRGCACRAGGSIAAAMKNGPVIGGIDRRLWRFSLFGDCHWRPLAQRGPALAVHAVENRDPTFGYTTFLRFIDDAVIQSHRPGRGFIGTCVLEAAIVENGDRYNARGDYTCRISRYLKHGGGAKLVLCTA